MYNEVDRRRAHLANGGTIANYDRSHYTKEKQMIPVTLTSTSGTTKRMEFYTKESILEFIELYKATLHQGQAVCRPGERHRRSQHVPACPSTESQHGVPGVPRILGKVS